jgi:hypothetical protein
VSSTLAAGEGKLTGQGRLSHHLAGGHGRVQDRVHAARPEALLFQEELRLAR